MTKGRKSSEKRSTETESRSSDPDFMVRKKADKVPLFDGGELNMSDFYEDVFNRNQAVTAAAGKPKELAILEASESEFSRVLKDFTLKINKLERNAHGAKAAGDTTEPKTEEIEVAKWKWKYMTHKYGEYTTIGLAKKIAERYMWHKEQSGIVEDIDEFGTTLFVRPQYTVDGKPAKTSFVKTS